MIVRRRPLIPIDSLDAIPEFATEAEEADFWATHRFGDRLLEEMQPPAADMLEWLPQPRPRVTERRRTSTENTENSVSGGSQPPEPSASPTPRLKRAAMKSGVPPARKRRRTS